MNEKIGSQVTLLKRCYLVLNCVSYDGDCPEKLCLLGWRLSEKSPRGLYILRFIVILIPTFFSHVVTV